MFAGGTAARSRRASRRTLRPRDGLRGRTARTDGASRSRYRAGGPGGTRRKSPLGPPPRVALPAIEANRQAGGTVRPNTSARLAGGGPPMAGHVCQSVSEVERTLKKKNFKSEKNQRRDRGIAPQTGRTGSPLCGEQVLRSLGAAAWRPMFSKTGFPISCRDTLAEPGVTDAHRWRRNPDPPQTPKGRAHLQRLKNLEKFHT